MLNGLNASASKRRIKRSFSFVFLITPIVTGFDASPRWIFRGAPRNGEPKNCAAVRSLMIQCAAVSGIELPVAMFTRPQFGAAASVQAPTVANGAALLPRIGRQVSTPLAVKKPDGSQAVFCANCSAV